jgi:hypothetical protein
VVVVVVGLRNRRDRPVVDVVARVVVVVGPVLVVVVDLGMVVPGCVVVVVGCGPLAAAVAGGAMPDSETAVSAAAKNRPAPRRPTRPG